MSERFTNEQSELPVVPPYYLYRWTKDGMEAGRDVQNGWVPACVLPKDTFTRSSTAGGLVSYDELLKANTRQAQQIAEQAEDIARLTAEQSRGDKPQADMVCAHGVGQDRWCDICKGGFVPFNPPSRVTNTRSYEPPHGWQRLNDLRRQYRDSGPSLAAATALINGLEYELHDAVAFSSTSNPKPLCYVLIDKDGKMFWDEEACVWGNPGDADSALEAQQDSDPEGQWRIAPLAALPFSASAFIEPQYVTTMRGLLSVAKCPACDGSGSIPHQVSEDRWEAEQCQWCDEKSQIPPADDSLSATAQPDPHPDTEADGVVFCGKCGHSR